MKRIFDNLKVFIASGDCQFNKALAEFLSFELNVEVVGISETYKDLIRSKNIHRANLIILDTNFSDYKCSDAVNHIFFHNHRQNIIALASENKQMCLESIILLGFKGVLLKDRFFDDLTNAINAIIHGKMYFPTDIEREHSLIKKN